MQRALRELADEGIVVRTQGSGTYVAEGRGGIDEPMYLRFLGGAGEPAFLPLFPKVLSRKRISERGPWSEWLRQTGADIVRINRRISVNGEFSLFNRFYFNADTFPGIASAPLSTLDGANLKQMLGGEINMPVTYVAPAHLVCEVPRGGQQRGRGQVRHAGNAARKRGDGRARAPLLPRIVHPAQRPAARHLVLREGRVSGHRGCRWPSWGFCTGRTSVPWGTLEPSGKNDVGGGSGSLVYLDRYLALEVIIPARTGGIRS